MFNTRLKELRTSNGDTQASLAEKMGVSSRTIASYEQGINEPSIDTLKNLAKYFGVTVDYLIGRSDGRILEDQEIYERLGLDDEAIFRLEQFNNLSEKNEYGKQRMKNINTLISDFETLTSISDYLSSGLNSDEYVICQVHKNGSDLTGDDPIAEKSLNANQWSNAFFSDIQENLNRLKDSITKGTP